jgi:hypothetical protein
MFYSEKGVSLFITVVILGVVLGIVSGLTSLVLRQIATVSGLGESVVALHAADSGIEKLTYELRKNSYSFSCTPPCEVTDIIWDNFDQPSLVHEVYFQEETPRIIIRSVGQYRQTRRAIEVTF